MSVIECVSDNRSSPYFVFFGKNQWLSSIFKSHWPIDQMTHRLIGFTNFGRDVKPGCSSRITELRSRTQVRILARTQLLSNSNFGPRKSISKIQTNTLLIGKMQFFHFNAHKHKYENNYINVNFLDCIFVKILRKRVFYCIAWNVIRLENQLNSQQPEFF